MCVLLKKIFIRNKHDTLFSGGLRHVACKVCITSGNALAPSLIWLFFSSGSTLIIFNTRETIKPQIEDLKTQGIGDICRMELVLQQSFFHDSYVIFQDICMKLGEILGKNVLNVPIEFLMGGYCIFYMTCD